MGIDGIGGGPPRIPGSSGGSGPAAEAGTTFRVEAPAASEVDAAGQAQAPGALERLHSGEIDLEQYLDARVADAVSHLEARLAPAQLDFVRAELRAQLVEDPVLVELVRRATRGVAGT